jgi:hypothetical protein
MDRSQRMALPPHFCRCFDKIFFRASDVPGLLPDNLLALYVCR